jgi:hypothetical protein
MAASVEPEKEALVPPEEKAPAPGKQIFSISTQDAKKAFISETSQCVVATIVLSATVTASVVCFYYYPTALVVLVPLGMILSCKVPYWQIPTYLCLILLIFHLAMCLYHHTHVVVF